MINDESYAVRHIKFTNKEHEINKSTFFLFNT
jgi:hypothetical protein